MISDSSSDASDATQDELLGRALYGNCLTGEALETWYAEEARGYFNLTNEQHLHYGDYVYDQAAATPFQTRALPKRRYSLCVAIGCAGGDDVLALGVQIDRIIAIEPTEDWWTNQIGNIPASFRAPQISGKIDLPDGSVDLIVAIGALHHVANVEFVVSEMARVLRPGGWMCIKEPIVSMGDFRLQRHGLTRNERGIPQRLMSNFIRAGGLRIEAKVYSGFNPIIRIAHRLGNFVPFNSKPFVLIDWLLCRLTAPLARYWRPHFWQKFAPSNACFVASKPKPI